MMPFLLHMLHSTRLDVKMIMSCQ